MTWVRLDDQFPIHRKVGPLSDRAFRLHVEALCWCARHLTDGVVSRSDLPSISRAHRPERATAELEARGAWIKTDTGWLIHDYLQYQQSRSKVLGIRAQREAAGRAGGRKSGESRRAGKAQPRAPAEANVKQKRSKTQAVGVEPPARLLRTEGPEGERAAAPTAALLAPTQTPPATSAPSHNGKPVALLAEARAKAAQAAKRARTAAAKRANPLAELRTATQPSETP